MDAVNKIKAVFWGRIASRFLYNKMQDYKKQIRDKSSWKKELNVFAIN